MNKYLNKLRNIVPVTATKQVFETEIQTLAALEDIARLSKWFSATTLPPAPNGCPPATSNAPGKTTVKII